MGVNLHRVEAESSNNNISNGQYTNFSNATYNLQVTAAPTFDDDMIKKDQYDA